MIDLKTKIAGGIATGVILAGILLPAGAFASTVTISGNGAHSHNGVHLTNSSSSTVKQVNKTAVVNLVGVYQNTGGNKANKNTGGGNVTVDSGNATAHVTNTTTTGGNSATLQDCGCPPANDTLTISGNGANSSNHINVSNTSSSSTTQINKTLVVNGVLVDQNTGGNQANSNTGGGTVDVNSGNANATVTNTTTTDGNSL